MAAEVAHHEGGGHRWTVIRTNNPDPRVRERIAFIDADELTALIARVATAEGAIARVRQLRDVFELNARTIDGVAGRNFFELFVEELDEALDPSSLPPEVSKEENQRP